MDPPPDDEDYASSHLCWIDRDEDLVASYWKTHRKPATHSEEHTMALRLEPSIRRQQRNNKITPAISSPESSQFSPIHPNTTIRLSPPTSPFFSSDDMSSVSMPLKVWQKSPMRNSYVYSRSPGDPSPPASLDDMTRVERFALCLGGSLPKPGQKSRKRTKESLKGKGQDRSDVIIDTSGGNNNMPPNSFSSQETPPGSNKSMPSATNESINATSHSTSSSYANNMANSYGSTQPQASGSTHQPTSDTSGSGGSANGTPEHSKKQRPNVPRIIIPDGTSINLSTPPTTPRQQARQIRPLKMPVPIWPDRFIQLRDRLKASEHMALFNWSKPSVAPKQDAQGQNADPKEPEPTTTTRTEAAPAHPDTTAATNGDPALTRLGFSPAFGIMGIPFYSTVPESETSSQNHIWWDYEDSDEESSHGGWCTKEWWRHLFCTWPGLTNTGKRLVTTTLGLVVILALALTALGRIQHQNRVSDVIPDSLEGKVFEAQVKVIRDFPEQTAKMMLEKRQGEVGEERLRRATVPFWEHPLGEGCFREQCEMEDIWKEFIAFMNPASFGIHLPQNWPSLCDSCIEISRNQFVYQTTVRVLGDLTQCAPTPPPPPSTVPPTLSPVSASKNQTAGNNGRATPPSPTPRKYHGHGTRTSVRKPDISKSTSKPLFRAPDARKAALPKRQVESPQETFPDLIVDTATFSNLTEYDSVNTIQSKEQLRVQFRFVLCDG